MKFDNLDMVILFSLTILIFVVPRIKKIETFDVFNHELYYPDVDCLLTSDNSCIIKPNNDSFYKYGCCDKDKKIGSDKYYEKVNSTCIDCINSKCEKHIENFESRAFYDKKRKIMYKTNTPGLYKKLQRNCNDNFTFNKDKKCQQIFY
tara:strand:+ start:688 stop:1131 length:444 start_codon:yes stop_codon:yes gene_type:complete